MVAVWHGWWFFPFLWIGWLVFIGLLFFGARRFWWRGRWEERAGHRSGESVLGERYARGEIDEDEYRKRLEVLRNPTGD